MKCLLCNSHKVRIIEEHNQADLAILWKGVYSSINEDLGLNKIYIYQCLNCNLKFFNPLLAGGDKFYSELGKIDWYYLHSGKTEYDYVQKYIKNGDKLLDIGAGRGVLYKKISTSISYTGIELSTKAVQLALEDGINVIQEDLLLHADSHKAYYDIVCLFQVLEHLTELDEFLKSIHLTLKNKGLFVIAVPDNDGFISRNSNRTFNLPPHHIILWTESSLLYLASKYGFEVIDVKREKLQDVHKESAYQSYLVSVIKKILFLPNLIIDRSIIHRVIAKIVRLLFKIELFRRLSIPIISPKIEFGQSIIVTLQKKNN